MHTPKYGVAAAGILFLAAAASGHLSAAAENDSFDAGTYRGRVLSDRFMRQQRLNRSPLLAKLATETASSLRQDIGDIAIIDTSNGVVAPPNLFDLSATSLLLTPEASGYSVQPGNQGIGAEAVTNGLPLLLEDDDFRAVRLPFAFPYFGKDHDVVYVHSDGNLTFEAPDARSTGRHFSRAFGGPPRILPLFADLDPSQPDAAINVYSVSDHVVFSWDAVPIFQEFGVGRRQTFQAVLFADGRIRFVYGSVTIPSAIVGIFPGRFEGDPTPADMSIGLKEPASGPVAEIFANQRELDCFAVTQQFFRNHDDVYDFVAVFNDINLSNAPAFAFQVNVRNEAHGIGDLLFESPVFDFGVDFGSPRRLSSFLNMGPLSNYPTDPEALVPLVGENSTLSILAHEVGHRFLAYPSFIDPVTGLRSPLLLGRQQAHWSFFLNTHASFLEGNRIEDRGAAAAGSPRFLTTETVSRYSELDQYLMGLRAPEEVAATFLVENPRIGIGIGNPARSPQSGVSFNGNRKNIMLDRIIEAEGPRLPDHNVAQREFRFAFILIVAQDSEPSPAVVAKLDRIREQWPAFYARTIDGRSVGHASLVKLLHLSTWPAGGIVVGRAGRANVEIAAARAVDLTVNLTASDGVLTIPPTVTIPAGELRAAFDLQGTASGLTTLTAEAAEPGFDKTVSRVQVRDRMDALKLEVLSGDGQVAVAGMPLPEAIVFRVIDRNFAPYSGLTLEFETSADGVVNVADTQTGALGRVAVNWKPPSAAGVQTLTSRLKDEPSVGATVQARIVHSAPRFSAAGVTNAASFESGFQSGAGFAPGSLLTIFGTGLAADIARAEAFPLPSELNAVQVAVNGVSAPLLFVSPTQINFQLPFEVTGERFTMTVGTPVGAGEPVDLALSSSQPGIFHDFSSGRGLIVNQDGSLQLHVPAAAGSTIQVFATGLGAVESSGHTGMPAPAFPPVETAGVTRAWIDDAAASVSFAGLAPFTAGIYQVNIELPVDLAPGRHRLAITVDDRKSNEVFFDSN